MYTESDAITGAVTLWKGLGITKPDVPLYGPGQVPIVGIQPLITQPEKK